MIPDGYPNLSRAVAMQVAAFPEHISYLARRFAGEDAAALTFADELAVAIERLSGDELATVYRDYRWFSDVMLEEEIFFRRNDRYRLTRFADAVEQVYANAPFMGRNMNGLLASQLWWRNHSEVLRYFRDEFLPGNPPGFSHLEVGPGHGLLLAIAAMAPGHGRCEGWDISEASLTHSRQGLRRLGIADKAVALRKIDIFAAPDAQYQSIVFSEVLEHLEEPLAALRALHRLLAPGGRVFVNAPVNSPAPGHLYLFRAPEEVEDMMRTAGFTIESSLFAPCTGATLDRARRLTLTISAAVIGTR